MKRFVLIFLALTLLLTSVLAAAEAVDPGMVVGGEAAQQAAPAEPAKRLPTYTIDPVLTRNSKVAKPKGDNPVVSGESLTTGLPFSGQYAPILCQIDNHPAAHAQWGIGSADIMYELPIQGQGWTRLTALFSDSYPAEAGPVRSGRTMHADLREEWDALFVNFGKQKHPGSNLEEVFKKYGVTKRELAVDGIGNKYQKYFAYTKYHAAPHHVAAKISDLSQWLKERKLTFPQHPFLFSDTLRTDGQPAHTFLIAHNNNKETQSAFVYDPAQNNYLRFTAFGPYVDYFKPDEPIRYANILVQRTKLGFNGSSLNPILPDVVGSGAADIFVNGRYIAGSWLRKDLKDRTYFFDEQGKEITLTRGKTWRILAHDKTAITVDPNPAVDLTTPIAAGSVSRSQKVDRNKPLVEIGDFKVMLTPSGKVLRNYTALRLDDFVAPVYAFSNLEGKTEFRVYGKRGDRGKLGFYQAELRAGRYIIGMSEPTLAVTVIGDEPVVDRKVFANFTGKVAEDNETPEGFTKAGNKGIYTFINLFGKKESVAFATLDGINYGWCQAVSNKPLVGGLFVDMNSIKDRMLKPGEVKMRQTKEFAQGYAIGVQILTTDGDARTVMTDKAPLPKVEEATQEEVIAPIAN